MRNSMDRELKVCIARRRSPPLNLSICSHMIGRKAGNDRSLEVVHRRSGIRVYKRQRDPECDVGQFGLFAGIVKGKSIGVIDDMGGEPGFLGSLVQERNRRVKVSIFDRLECLFIAHAGILDQRTNEQWKCGRLGEKRQQILSLVPLISSSRKQFPYGLENAPGHVA